MRRFVIPNFPATRPVTVCVLAALVVFCLPARADDGFAESFAGPIEKAHGLEAWRRAAAVEADIAIDYGGQRILEGRMLFETGAGRSRFELKDGTLFVWDGREAWVAPASSTVQGARFHVLTWPYFLAVPMKLRDPGSKLTDLGSMSVGGSATMPAARLTFDEGIGDTPGDWYVLYRDPKTSRLAAMGYIVTYGKAAAEAEKEPHAIGYDGFITVDGVTLPTRWGFHNWRAETGPHGEPIGRVELNNLRFVTPPPGSFDKPAGARADALPAP